MDLEGVIPAEHGDESLKRRHIDDPPTVEIMIEDAIEVAVVVRYDVLDIDARPIRTIIT